MSQLVLQAEKPVCVFQEPEKFTFCSGSTAALTGRLHLLRVRLLFFILRCLCSSRFTSRVRNLINTSTRSLGSFHTFYQEAAGGDPETVQRQILQNIPKDVRLGGCSNEDMIPHLSTEDECPSRPQLLQTNRACPGHLGNPCL
ncbi:unnamed protein product [Pleuronectes platessa]|uniref:Uncharacterized protein n=1 Tax=Pleuronectes platessa TaxID=8262 RepID=A0A9N7TI49_PLEPL|nr:unnamed protein product [Pleuronectes platessa]